MSFVAVAIGTAFVGAVVQHQSNSKARRATRRAQEKQERQAREAARLKSTKDDTGAKVKIGADALGLDEAGSSNKKGRASRRTKNSLGGVSASKLGGL